MPDVSTAIARLQGFKFVGVTSDWERSICLFHAKLGGPCYAVEFEDSRPTSGNESPSTYPTTPLGGLNDVYDGALYAAVLSKYKADVEAHNVSEGLCRTLCPAMADQLPDGKWKALESLLPS